jgi:hypothetical protein
MNPYLAFIIGLVVGTCGGFLLLGILAGPRIAELEHTVRGLRALLGDYHDQ